MKREGKAERGGRNVVNTRDGARKEKELAALLSEELCRLVANMVFVAREEQTHIEGCTGQCSVASGIALDPGF